MVYFAQFVSTRTTSRIGRIYWQQNANDETPAFSLRNTLKGSRKVVEIGEYNCTGNPCKAPKSLPSNYENHGRRTLLGSVVRKRDCRTFRTRGGSCFVRANPYGRLKHFAARGGQERKTSLTWATSGGPGARI